MPSVTSTETEARSSLSRVDACTERFPPKFGATDATNQIRVRAMPARALPAGFCEYKRGPPAASESFGLGFSSGEVKVR